MEQKITLEHIAHAKLPSGDVGNATLHRMNDSHAELTHWALSFLPHFLPSKILDIGCGGGATIKRLMDNYPDAFVDGVDYSNTSVQLSKEFNADTLGVKCNVQQADVASLPFEDSSFNLVTAFETVYFWGDIDNAFSQVNRVLAEEGLFLICCEMSDKKNPRWENVLSSMHILSLQEWSNYLIQNDFDIFLTQKLNDEWICIIGMKK